MILKAKAAAALVGLFAWFLASAGAAQTWRALPLDDGAGAAVQWESGAAIIGRCQGGAFSLLLGPVHSYASSSRSHFRLNGGEWEPVSWAASDGARALFSKTAARMARKISAGGTLELRFTEDDRPPVLYQLEITGSGAPLLDVLSECGLPLSDPRDELQIVDAPDWTALPGGHDLAFHYPDPDSGREGEGTVLCTVTDTGVPRDCEITYDSPPGAGFGQATRAVARRFRLQREQAAEFEGWLVSIAVKWRIS